jgi:hypothetical protein
MRAGVPFAALAVNLGKLDGSPAACRCDRGARSGLDARAPVRAQRLTARHMPVTLMGRCRAASRS